MTTPGSLIAPRPGWWTRTARIGTAAGSYGWNSSTGGVPSAEKFGLPTVTPGGVTIHPTGIPSGEAMGSDHFLYPQSIGPTGIASAEAFGGLTVIPGPVSVAPTGIGSGEAVGTPSVALILFPTGIPSTEAFGGLTVIPGPVDVDPSGIASVEAFGTLTVVLEVDPSGIGSAEAFGGLTVIPGPVDVDPTGISSAEAFGGVDVVYPQDIDPTGIGSAEAFGTAEFDQQFTLTGIASTEAFGTVTVTPGAVTVSPSGIGSAEAFGTLTVGRGTVTVAPSGIASAEAFGTPVITVPPIYDATGTGSATTNTGSTSFSFTAASGADVFVFVGYNGGLSGAPTVTYGGAPGTLLGTVYNGSNTSYQNDTAAGGAMSLYRFAGAGSGSAKTVLITCANAATVTGDAVSVKGVHSVGTVQTAHGTGTALSQSVTSAAGQLVLQGFNADASAITSYNQTSLYNAYSGNYFGYGTTVVIGSAVGASTVSCTATSNAAQAWGGIAISIS